MPPLLLGPDVEIYLESSERQLHSRSGRFSDARAWQPLEPNAHKTGLEPKPAALQKKTDQRNRHFITGLRPLLWWPVLVLRHYSSGRVPSHSLSLRVRVTACAATTSGRI